MRNWRSLGLVGMYIGAQLVALVLADPFRSAGLATTSNPNNPTNPLGIIVAIVVAPLVILYIARSRNALTALRWVLLVLIASALLLTMQATFALFVPAFFFPPIGAAVVGDPSVTLGAMVATGSLLLLAIDPQWYVVDGVGLLAGASLIAILGISFGILPVFILLLALAVYDAIAVYGTKHMISLADAVTEMKLPILMVMPTQAGYDYPNAPSFREQRGRPLPEREATFMGLGDVVIPGALVVSAFVWLPGTGAGFGAGANLVVALGAMVGSLVGYTFLMRRISGGPQAGLPFLNTGAILGYIATFLIVYRSTGLGLTLNL